MLSCSLCRRDMRVYSVRHILGNNTHTHSMCTFHLGMSSVHTRASGPIIQICIAFSEPIEDNLTVHSRMHTGDKASCHLCHASYFTKLQLQNHIKTTHYKSDGRRELGSQLTRFSVDIGSHIHSSGLLVYLLWETVLSQG